MAIDEATARASLASVPGVNTDNPTALLFGFVGQKRAQLGKAPTVQPTVLPTTASLSPGSDVGQIFNNDSSTGSYGVNDLPTELVVQVASKLKQFTRKPFEVSLSASGAFSLQGTTEPKVSVLKFTPATLAEEAIVGSHSRTAQTKVHTDRLAVIGKFNIGQGHHNMQPKATFTLDKVCAVEAAGSVKRRLEEVGHSDWKDNPTGDGGEAHSVVVREHPVATSIVPDWRKFRVRAGHSLPFLAESQSRLHRFSCANPSGADELGGQGRMLGSQRIIGRFMQFHAVLLAVLPTVITNGIETGRVLSDGFRENSRLCFCWVEKQSYCALHSLSVSYVARICKKKEGGLRRALLLPALKRRGFHSAYVL